jgi:hypothetical protein
MSINVEITVRRHGRIVDRREGHNIWVDSGREYLARAIAFTNPLSGTTPGSVDLVANFPTLTTEFFYFRVGHHTGAVDYRVQLASPADATELLSQINAQIPGAVASLGAGNGLVFTPAAATGLELMSGSALSRLGLVPEKITPAGMTSTPLETGRVKYMGFGIGGRLQGSSTAFAAPYDTSYQPGEDPNATAGNKYDTRFPTAPSIASLERPVRISGTEDPYPGDPADVWLVQDPKFTSFIAGTGIIKFHGTVDGPSGDIAYGSFTDVPLSEVGLFLSDADVNDAYNVSKLVAYHSFATILFTAGTQMELVWTVSF